MAKDNPAPPANVVAAYGAASGHMKADALLNLTALRATPEAARLALAKWLLPDGWRLAHDGNARIRDTQS